MYILTSILISSIFLLFYTKFSQEIPNTHMYVPIHSLRKSDICSIISVAFIPTTIANWKDRVDTHQSRQTMLCFLLSIRSAPDNQRVLNFINECYPKFDWNVVEQTYENLSNTTEPYQKQFNIIGLGTYWELRTVSNFQGIKNSRKYIEQNRTGGFQPNELKIYWNYDHIQSLIYCDHYDMLADNDVSQALINIPVKNRRNSGNIKFIQLAIQDAVFNVPQGKQVIVLDFADERMPGGFYLSGAKIQEEAILYNSDGFRAILDLKYTMMDGGYMLPEYGVAYIKHVRFFKQKSTKQCVTDLIIAACYDLSISDQNLYQPPSGDNETDIRSRTLQKIRAIIASAVANTEGDGENTYLLLGPIGTGVFKNNETVIAELFYHVLTNKLMDSEGPIRYAFQEIQFVSFDKKEKFEDVFKNI